MATKKIVKSTGEIIPILKTVEQMSRISGIGENRLRELIAKRMVCQIIKTEIYCLF